MYVQIVLCPSCIFFYLKSTIIYLYKSFQLFFDSLKLLMITRFICPIKDFLQTSLICSIIGIFHFAMTWLMCFISIEVAFLCKCLHIYMNVVHPNYAKICSPHFTAIYDRLVYQKRFL